MSLGGSSVDLGDCEHLGPDCGQGVVVRDFDDLDLGEDAVVERQLFALEGDEHALAEVDGEQVGQLLHGVDFAVVALDFVRDITGVRLVFEECREGLLTGSHICQVLLSIAFLLLKFFNRFHTLVAFLHGVEQRIDIEKLALGPVVNVDVWVLQLGGQFGKLLEDFGVLLVGHDQLGRVHVRVVLKVHVLIPGGCPLQVLVALDRIDLVAHH